VRARDPGIADRSAGPFRFERGPCEAGTYLAQRTLLALRRDPASSDRFPQDVLELQALLGPVQPGQFLQAVPGADTNVPLWILGSSLFGAQLAAMTKGLPKANLPTPSVTHFFRGRASIDPKVYADVDALMADVARAYREEVADLAARGCTYLQMDEVPLAVICDPRNRDIVKARGEDPDRVIDAYIDVINTSIRDRPANMAVAVHMCRGNMGHGMASGGYDAIAERLFGRLDVDGYLLEYDTPRAGDFHALRFVPKGKRVAIGIMTTKIAEIEPADTLKRRIEEASRSIPLDQLCLCPQCGFSSNAGTGTLPLDVVERKLARVVEVADQVWSGKP